ncbi:MAG: helix-turn-helix domain-containing protein [Candidatus Arcticimaribacter sp.]
MYRSGCPLASALDIIGDKWSLVIIRDLFLERSTFKAFLAGPEGIASNILAQRLKWLTEQGLIDFAFKKDNQKVKHYYLTDRGIDLYPSMHEIMKWSQNNLDKALDPLTIEWNEKNKHKSDKVKIREMIANYREHKINLLSAV